jgi:hypothetical protein
MCNAVWCRHTHALSGKTTDGDRLQDSLHEGFMLFWTFTN